MVFTATRDKVAVGRHRKLADSDDSDEEGATPKKVLTTAKASDLCPKPHRLIAQNAGFTSMEDMSTLSALDYVDLKGNALKSVQGLASNRRLKTLILKHNKLSNVDPILATEALQILDISDNEFISTDWLPRASFAANLVALVARGNSLVALEGLACLRGIQTLVLSNNEIEDISPATQLVSLTKLSASSNCIRVIPDSIANLHNLRELRLAHNRLAILPSKEILARLSSLKIFDIGHNRITSIDNLSTCSDALVQINAAGNPACEQDPNFLDHLLKLCPKVEIVDGRRIAGGRRKVRVNRQRLEAGFPLEPERKFARPPSAYYLQKAKEGQGDMSKSEKELTRTEGKGNRNDSRKSAKRRERHIATAHLSGIEEGQVAKKQRRTSPKVEDDDVLDANHFVRMARGENVPSGGVTPSRKGNMTGSEDDRLEKGAQKRKKRKKTNPTLREKTVEFGGGGESKW